MSKNSTKKIDLANISSNELKELYVYKLYCDALSEDRKMAKMAMVCVCVVFLVTMIVGGIFTLMGI